MGELEKKKRRVLAALVRLRAGRVFSAYVRLWALAQIMRLVCMVDGDGGIRSANSN